MAAALPQDGTVSCAGCGGKDVVSPSVRVPWTWSRGKGSVHLSSPTWGSSGRGSWSGTRLVQPSKLLAREGTVINDDGNLHFFGAFYLAMSKHNVSTTQMLVE